MNAMSKVSEVDNRTEIDVFDLLIWAFQTERASIDFEDNVLGHAPACYGTEYVMLQQGRLGCRVDGGGFSYPADDADLVAAAVAMIPPAVGGRRMAARIAELARVGRAEDWFPNPSPRCEPKAWGKRNQYGDRAKTEVCGRYSYSVRGREVKRDIQWCPVVYRDTAQEVAAARRRYTLWVQALAEVRMFIAVGPSLERWKVTWTYPNPAPWQKQA